MSPSRSSLCWLHLSDLHIREQVWEQDGLLKSLQRDLPGLLERAARKPDLVFVTGDIAFSGQEKQLDGAHRFLIELMQELGLDPGERLFLAPGNHDVDRARIDRFARRDQAFVLGLEDADFREELLEIESDTALLGRYGARLEAFCTFTGRLLGPARAVMPDRPWRTDIVELDGLKVGVASLCSAWMCGPDEDRPGRIVLGERQLREAMDEIAGASLRLALMHHPLDWLHLGEKRRVSELLRDRAHVTLHGHNHEPDLELRATSQRQMVLSAAGAVYAGATWPRGFQVGQVDFGSENLSLDFFAWSDRDGGFWCPDNQAQKGAANGRVTLALKVEGLAPRGEAPAASGLVARLARTAINVYGQGGFIGLPSRAVGRVSAGLRDRFVPVDLGVEGDKARTVKLEELVRGLLPPRAPSSSGRTGLAALRAVVLGDPGSGKTTLCRYLAVEAAEAQPPRVPILVALRDWLRDGDGMDLLDFGAKELSSRLQVKVERSDLERMAEANQAVLLIDGLDEVVRPEQRVAVRDQVTAIATNHPFLPILCTSRIVGYDQCPLDRRFNHLRVLPFDDARLTDFVEHWSAAAHPADPVARGRARAELQAALEAEPRAKELARNPLMATLIALVFHHETRLPGERAKLYELVARTLLETWPEAAGRRFPDLDVGRQRAVLEKLALRMQEARSEQGALKEGVTIDAAELERALAELLAIRDVAGREPAEHRRLARRWVDWLAAHTGLLVEQRPGVFAFLHLSLLEYLAGQALLQREGAGGDAAVARFVAAHHREAKWQETLLLMLGSQATCAGLLDAVFESLDSLMVDGAASSWTTMVFLLRALREEVDLGAFRRERVLRGLKSSSLEVWPSNLGESRRWLRDLVRFSHRHGEGTRRWFQRELGQERRFPLLSAAALCPLTEDSVVQDALLERKDRDDALAELLHLWPAQPWGGLAQQHSRPAVVLRFAGRVDVDWALGKALPAMEARWSDGEAALGLALMRRAATVGTLARYGEGCSGAVTWSSGGEPVARSLAPACRPRQADPAIAQEATRQIVSRPAFPYLIIRSALSLVNSLGSFFALDFPTRKRRGSCRIWRKRP